MSTYALTFTMSRHKQQMGLAFVLGGLLWLANFAQIMSNGSLFGNRPAAVTEQIPFFQIIGFNLFVLLIVVLNIGLGGLLSQTKNGEKRLGMAAVAFMGMAILFAVFNLFSLSGFNGQPLFNHTLMSWAIFSTAVATGLLGATVLRNRVLPQWVPLLLMLVGMATLPMLLETLFPNGLAWFVTNHIAFLFSGLIYAFASAGIWAAEP